MDTLEQIEQRVGSLSLEFVEGLLADYLQNPDSVSPDWRSYFDEITRRSGGNGNGARQAMIRQRQRPGTVTQIGPSFNPNSFIRAATSQCTPVADDLRRVAKRCCHQRQAGDQWHIAVLQDRVDQLIRAYRVRGHLVAQIDPLGLPRPELPELDPAFYGFTEADLDREFSTDTIQGPQA